MPLSVPDMTSCNRKCKCCGGPNDGRVYPCDDPCDGPSETFNEQLCQCIATCSNNWEANFEYAFYNRDILSSRYPFDCEYGAPVPDYSYDELQNITQTITYSLCVEFIRWDYIGTQSADCTGTAINCGASGTGMTEQEAEEYFGVDTILDTLSIPVCGMTDSIYFIGRWSDIPENGIYRGLTFADVIQRGTMDDAVSRNYAFRRYTGVQVTRLSTQA